MKRVLTQHAKTLRQNLTEAEEYLWYQLKNKNLGVKFRRQSVIGRYIVDFVCYEKRLVIEVDGGQHSDSKRDQIRNRWLQQQGFKIFRVWNNDVLRNREGVLEEIVKFLNSPSLTLPTKGEGSNGRDS